MERGRVVCARACARTMVCVCMCLCVYEENLTAFSSALPNGSYCTSLTDLRLDGNALKSPPREVLSPSRSSSLSP
jgi:hypothetical protein